MGVANINGFLVSRIYCLGIFKIEDSAQVARLWGIRKNRPAMNYDKLSRSIRQYYKKGIIRKPDISQRLVYQFVHPIWKAEQREQIQNNWLLSGLEDFWKQHPLSSAMLMELKATIDKDHWIWLVNCRDSCVPCVWETGKQINIYCLSKMAKRKWTGPFRFHSRLCGFVGFFSLKRKKNLNISSCMVWESKEGRNLMEKEKEYWCCRVCYLFSILIIRRLFEIKGAM